MQNSQNQKEQLRIYNRRENIVLLKVFKLIFILSIAITIFFWVIVILIATSSISFDGLIGFKFFLLPAIVGTIITLTLLILQRTELSALDEM